MLSRSLSTADWRIRFDPDERGELFAEELNRTHRADARWMNQTGGADWQPVRIGAAWPRDYHGVAWYRVTLPDVPRDRRTFVEFESVDYTADVWCNGRCVGSHEGPSTSFDVELTPYVRDGVNVLHVRVDSPVAAPGFREETDQPKTLFKGVLERADINDPNVVPGGITGDVTLIQTGPARLAGVHVAAFPVTDALSGEPLGEHADSLVTVTAYVDGPIGVPVDVTLRLRAPDGRVRHDGSTRVTLTGGSLPVTVQVPLADAALWWPWDLGTPALHAAEIGVRVGDAVSDAVTRRFGIRSVRRGDGWATYVNNVRIFQRGANYVCDQLREHATAARYRADADLLVGANLNTVHPFCVVERTAFYDACDEVGLLVYQDFPAWTTMDDSGRSVRRALAVQRELITRLAGHPSVIVWNCGSQASVGNMYKLCSALAEQARRLDPSRIANLGNAAIATAEETHRAHPTRSFFWSPEHARELVRDLDWRPDTHQYQGWYTGQTTDLRRQPTEYLTLVTEFGAQGVPDRDALRELFGPEQWPPD
jgi:beta-mannosidase